MPALSTRRPLESIVEVKPGSGADLLQVFSAYAGEKIIQIPKGDYNLGSDYLKPTLTETMNIIMRGRGRHATRILGSGLKMLDVQNTEWGTGGTSGIIQLEDLQIRHTAPTNGIGLDLEYGVARLKNVSVRNLDAGKTDKIGIYCGVGGNSQLTTWEAVEALYYGKGIIFGHDHLTIQNALVVGSTQFCYGFITSGIHTTLINPHIYLTGAEPACHGYYFDTPPQAVTIINPYFEPHATTHTGYMFYVAAAGYSVVQVFGATIWVGASNFGSIGFCNDFTIIKFRGTRRRTVVGDDKRTENFLSYVDIGTSSTALPHGLSGIPNRIDPIPTTNVTIWRPANPDATNIYLQASAACKAFIYVSIE